MDWQRCPHLAAAQCVRQAVGGGFSISAWDHPHPAANTSKIIHFSKNSLLPLPFSCLGKITSGIVSKPVVWMGIYTGVSVGISLGLKSCASRS